MLMNGHQAPAEIISNVAEAIDPIALESYMAENAEADGKRLAAMLDELHAYSAMLADTGRRARALGAQKYNPVYGKCAEAVEVLCRHIVATLRVHRVG